MAQGQAALLVHPRQHRVDVGVVHDEETFRIADRVAVLFQHRDAETVKGGDIARVVVADQTADAGAHDAGGLVGEGGAEDMAGQDAKLRDQIGEAAADDPRLAGAGARDDAHRTLSSQHGLTLFLVQSRKDVFAHVAPPAMFSSLRKRRTSPFSPCRFFFRHAASDAARRSDATPSRPLPCLTKKSRGMASN